MTIDHKMPFTKSNKMQLSQVEFAKRLGVSFDSVSRWEKGHFEPIIKYEKEITKLCEKCDIYASSDRDDVYVKCMKKLNKDPLMERAFIDSSYKNHDHSINQDNSLLATYGDAVLKLAFCEALYDYENLTNEKVQCGRHTDRSCRIVRKVPNQFYSSPEDAVIKALGIE